MHEIPGCRECDHESYKNLYKMSNPVFIGHAHKHYGWNKSCAILSYLYIHEYLYLWLLKKNPPCFKELLTGQMLEESTLTKVFQHLSTVNIHSLKGYKTITEINNSEDLRVSGAPKMPYSSSKVFSLVSSPCTPHWPFGIVSSSYA